MGMSLYDKIIHLDSDPRNNAIENLEYVAADPEPELTWEQLDQAIDLKAFWDAHYDADED